LISPLADKLEIWGTENDTIIFSDGSLGFGLNLKPIDIDCWDDGKINHLASQAAHFLNGLPLYLDLQFIQEIEGGNEDRIREHEHMGEASSNEVASALTQTRVQRLKTIDSQGCLPSHKLKVFVRKPPRRKLLERPKLFSKPKLFEKIADENLREEMRALAAVKENIIQSFKVLSLDSTLLNSDEVAMLLYTQWNPNRLVSFAGFDPDDIRQSVLFTDVAISEKGFSMRDVHYRVISLKLLPKDETIAGMARTLRQLPFNSKLFLTIHVPDQQKQLESLQTQRRITYSMASGKRGVNDIESETKLNDLEGLLEAMIAQGEKVFLVSLNVVLCHQDEQELDSQVSQTLMTFRELAGSEGMEESLASFDIFAELAIPNARSKERRKALTTSNLSDLLPIYGPWSGHSKSSILLRTRAGSLIGFDPFSSDLTNYNQIVSGGSGSGKSFLTNVLLLQMLKENPKIFIIDIGGSYKKLCDNLNGQYIPLGTSDLSINPFDLLPGETSPPDSKIKFLVGLIEMMTKENGEQGLKRLERSILEEAIQQVYESSSTPSLNALKNILTEHSEIEVRRLGQILSAWCGDSPYGKFVDRPTTVDFKKSVVCFDLKGIETPDLQAVALYLITDLVWREFQRDRNTKKFLVFDECWRLLEAGSAFVAEVFRTLRKYYGSAIAISQNIDDFAKSKVAAAILSNSSIKWILMQKGADQARLKEVLQLNDNEAQLITTLYQERGVYSEAFLMAGDQRSVVAIESTPLEYWIATTDPRDLSKFEEELNKSSNHSQLEVLKELARAYPQGMVASMGAETTP